MVALKCEKDGGGAALIRVRGRRKWSGSVQKTSESEDEVEE